MSLKEGISNPAMEQDEDRSLIRVQSQYCEKLIPCNMIFEAVLKGFDGSTDTTDHLVKWISAPSKEKAEEAISKAGLELDRPIEEITDPIRLSQEDIDIFVD
jgi:ABC-type phosphate/phosphonate transport system ATPase subunit